MWQLVIAHRWRPSNCSIAAVRSIFLLFPSVPTHGMTSAQMLWYYPRLERSFVFFVGEHDFELSSQTFSIISNYGCPIAHNQDLCLRKSVLGSSTHTLSPDNIIGKNPITLSDMLTAGILRLPAVEPCLEARTCESVQYSDNKNRENNNRHASVLCDESHNHLSRIIIFLMQFPVIVQK